MRHLTVSLVAVLLTFVDTMHAGVARFQGVGDLPGGAYHSMADGISADGLAVVGMSAALHRTDAFRWTTTDGIQPLPNARGWDRSAASASAGGSVVVGSFNTFYSPSREAFRWIEDSDLTIPDNQPLCQGLGDLPGGKSESKAFGVSAGGSVVVGGSPSDLSGINPEAFRWVDGNGNRLVDPEEILDNCPECGLGDLPGGGFASQAISVSADGAVVVGWGTSEIGREAFRWTPDLGMTSLGYLSEGAHQSLAYDVSADGTIVVGSTTPGAGGPAFRWILTDPTTGTGVMEALPRLPGHESVAYYAYGVSADGSVIIGNVGAAYPFLWDEANGVRKLQDFLEERCEPDETSGWADLTGWTLERAFDISDDGLVIVGYGTNPSGDTEGWVAIIPEPSTLVLLAMAAVALLACLRRREPLTE